MGGRKTLRRRSARRLDGRMSRTCIIAAWMLLFAGSIEAAEEPRYRLIDLTVEYVRVWSQTRELAAEERIASFRKELAALYPAFYGVERYGQEPERLDRKIRRSFEQFPEISERYSRIAAGFRAMLNPAMQTFRARFPDFDAMPPVYLLHSLGELDGGTRMLDGELVLVFGADVMARAHDFEDEAPFLHHELFHVYHQRYFPGCDAVWCALWTEGLAVYVAQQLNPNASDSQLLLNVPEPIRPQVDAHLTEAVCALEQRLASTDSRDLEALFSFERLDERVPPRAGYYLGYLAARKLGENRTLAELAQLSPEQVRPLIGPALGELRARGGAGSCGAEGAADGS